MESVLPIQAADGYVGHARSFGAASGARAALLIFPGLGIPSKFYLRLAAWLGEREIAGLILENRGVGLSADIANPRSVRMSDWGQYDCAAALAKLRERHPDLPHHVLGHSGGAQLLGLAEGAERLESAIFVAGQHGAASNWPFPASLKVTFAWHILLPLLCVGREYFPARRFGLSAVDIPTGIIRQWASFGRSRDYLFDPRHGLETWRYGDLQFSLLSLEIEDDPFSSPRAAARLLEKYSGAAVERRRLPREIGHFGFFRAAAEEHWGQVSDWILEGGRPNLRVQAGPGAL